MKHPASYRKQHAARLNDFNASDGYGLTVKVSPFLCLICTPKSLGPDRWPPEVQAAVGTSLQHQPTHAALLNGQENGWPHSITKGTTKAAHCCPEKFTE
jgi:hypothetical protein